MNGWQALSSVGAGVVLLVAALLIWTVGDKHTPRLTAFMVLAGSTLITGTYIAQQVQKAVNFANNGVGAAIGFLTGQVIGWLLAGGLLYVFGVHIWKKRVNAWTLIVAASIPFSIALIPGLVGRAGTGLVHGFAHVTGSGVAALFGG